MESVGVVSFSVGEWSRGGVQVNPTETLPVLIFPVKIKGEVVFRWCLTEEAAVQVRGFIDEFLDGLK